MGPAHCEEDNDFVAAVVACPSADYTAAVAVVAAAAVELLDSQSLVDRLEMRNLARRRGLEQARLVVDPSEALSAAVVAASDWDHPRSAGSIRRHHHLDGYLRLIRLDLALPGRLSKKRMVEAEWPELEVEEGRCAPAVEEAESWTSSSDHPSESLGPC